MSPGETTTVRAAVHTALSRHERILLAVSGGLDSMVLLNAAAESGASRLTVATFDHGTGPAATAAVSLVRERCAELGIDCVTERANESLSTEAAFRVARWTFLRATARALGDKVVIATAHTADDQVETVLLRIMRGAGARGIAGLYAGSDVVRPLLGISRRELESYAAAHRVGWVEDPTNASHQYARNRARHDLLPALRQVCASIDADLLNLACDAARWRDEVDDYIDRELILSCRRDGLDVGASAVEIHSPTELAVLWPAIASRVGLALDRRGTSRLAAFSARARVGARIQLAGDWEVVRSRDSFQLRVSTPPVSSVGTISASGGEWGDWSFRPTTNGVGDDAWSAVVPTDGSVVVRRWRPGDTMTACAGAPPRTVKRLLSKAGVTGHERAHWPVVLVGDQIVWIPGVRRSDAATARSGRPGLPFVCEHHNP